MAPHGEELGIDTALTPPRDGQPRTVPVIQVSDLDDATARVGVNGGAVVFPPFELTGVGRGCYVFDPVGLLIGLHYYSG